jgi:alkanesulfonate monooxygenase SsuD/methylene tetrahydromethanopterin reductase-like flavin-dependent oxidoreductase (luciferase family)
VEDPNNFNKFDEATDIRVRARMLDEALDIIVGLWSGESFSYSGDYYNVREVTFLPKPAQSPRIPIWIGGGWPLKGPTERAARWDGSCLYKHAFGGPWLDWTPDDIRSLRSFVAGRNRASVSYDIAVGGRERNPDWEQERRYIRSIAEAGATWWVEYVEPAGLEETWTSIERGPLRDD